MSVVVHSFLEEKEVASKSALKSEQFLYCASWGRLVDVEACFSGLEWGWGEAVEFLPKSALGCKSDGADGACLSFCSSLCAQGEGWPRAGSICFWHWDVWLISFFILPVNTFSPWFLLCYKKIIFSNCIKWQYSFLLINLLYTYLDFSLF